MYLNAAFHCESTSSVTLILDVHLGTQFLHATRRLCMSNTIQNLTIQEKVTARTQLIDLDGGTVRF